MPQNKTELAKLIFEYIDRNIEVITAVTADGVNVDDFVGAYKQAVNESIPEKYSLATCPIESHVKALQASLATGLRVGSTLGHAYVIARKNRAEFQPGYLGLVKVAYESPLVAGVNAEVIKSQDQHTIEGGTDPQIRHVMRDGDRGDTVGAYAIVWLTSGVKLIRFMTTEEIDRHRAKFVKGSAPAWSTAYDAQAMKTVALRALKYAPLRAEVRAVLQAAEYDEAGVSGDSVRSGDKIPAEASEGVSEALRAENPEALDEVELDPAFGEDEPENKPDLAEEVFGGGKPVPADVLEAEEREREQANRQLF